MFLNELKAFIVTAECLNFTRAAEILYLSQPGLSKLISSMETSLGVKLFRRSTRNVILTKEGEAFLLTCRSFIQQCNELSLPRATTSYTLTDSLRIGIGEFIEQSRFPQIINDFSKRHEFCNISVLKYAPVDLLKALDNDSIDIAVLATFSIPTNKYKTALIQESHLTVVVPKNHRFAGRNTVKISELKDEKFISIFPSSNPAIDIIRKICMFGGFSPNIVKETNSLSTNFLYIIAGFGINLHFEFYKNAWKNDLIFIPLDLEGNILEEEQGIAAAWKPDNLRPSVTCFSEFLY